MSTKIALRCVGAAAFGVALAVSTGVLETSGRAAWAATPTVASVGRVEAPLGLQGARGAGANVGVIFNLVDPTRRKTDVEVQYGRDVNGDGRITDGTEQNADGTPAGFPNEYRAATEDRIDSRNTRRNRAPQLFSTAGDIGAIQQYVWKSSVDLRSERLLTTAYMLTPQGRLVPDPDNPGSYLFATGPNGEQVFAGVQVRVRAVRTLVVKRRPTKYAGAWAYSTSFNLNNNNKPEMTIDSIDSNGVSVPTASDEDVLIHWTAYDADSEDLNGNDKLDIVAGEDANGDGQLNDERVGVAFDYHRLGAGEDPATMTPAQIAALSWLPCTRADGVGDTDSLLVSPGVPPPTTGDLAGLPSAPPGKGRAWTFAWNSVADVGTVYSKFIFRARTFDQKGETGDYVYRTAPTQLDNWRIFNPGYAAFPLVPLASGRVGHTVTRVQSSIDATDPLDRGDDKGLLGFQSILVAGGSSTIGGASVADLDLMPINTITAETSTSARIALSLLAARSYHTATPLDDGRILFIGGFDASGANPTASTEIYDPKTQSVTAGPDLATARARHAAIKLTSGDVAVFGGIGAGGATLASCELVQFKPYADAVGDPIPTASWTVAPLPSMAVAQSLPLVALLPDQTVLVTGGIGSNGLAVQTAQLLNPLNAGPDLANPQIKAPNFVSAPSMLQARKYGTATPLIDGNVLFAGGSGRNDFEIFNSQTLAFEPVDAVVTMSVPRAQHVASLRGSGTVLLAGGTEDPDAASPTAVTEAEVFRIGARSAAGFWSGSFDQINGELKSPRRLAKAAVVESGRAFIVGGADATTTTASVETYTGANGVNLAPKARVYLPTTVSSWLYGTPLYYRLTDPEQDPARVEVQYIDRTPTGERNWRAASAQSSTIGGDLAELTADLATTLNDDLSLVIDPVSHNTTGDHAYVWSMSHDIPRPAVGATVVNGYNLRVIPFGAVRGTSNESAPISVLYNTKVVPTIWPFENYADQRPDLALPAGAPTANQAGDIRVWVHLRDVDGGGPGTNGDTASVLYEYSIDKNGDGLIKDTDLEFFFPMTPRGAPVGFPATTNPQVDLQTYYDAPADSNPTFPPPGAGNLPLQDATHRPSSQGWTYFDWDSVYDIGVPPSSYSNIWVRISPSDVNNNQTYPGVVQVLRNINGQPPVLTVVRHPDSVYLVSWQPRFAATTTGAAVTKSTVPINDPIDFTFNGNIEPSSVNAATLPVYRGTTTTSQVRGKYTVVNDLVNHTSLVTFWPDGQDLLTGSIVYGQAAASTVLFPNDDYSFRIPGYVFASGAVPPQNAPPGGVTILPLGGTVAQGVYSTYLLIQAVPINSTGTDANYKFHTAAAGVYAEDNIGVSLTDHNTLDSSEGGLPIGRTYGQGPSAGVQFTFSRALDPATVKSPNITTLLTSTSTGGTRSTNPVVPGQWTVTNVSTVNGATVTTTSVAKFVPLFQLPGSQTLRFTWNAGLKATNGHAVPTSTFNYVVETYSQIPNNAVVLESFATQNQNDATGLPPTAQASTATWGNEGCAPGTLSGATAGLSGISVPSGNPGDLNVAAGGTTILTAPVTNCTNLNVAKNGTLVLACPTGAMTLNASGNVTIAGTVVFKGASGWNGGHFGPIFYPYYGAGSGGAVTAPVRAGGAGVNGGGSGGSGPSCPSTTTTYRIAGNNGSPGLGTTTTYGQGGRIATESGTSYTARYLYGAGGAAGGGNGTVGLAGGRDCAYSGFSTASGYGAYSVPGAAANDAFLSGGMTGGGGGGGGGSANYASPTTYGFHESGGGGAGAGAVSLVCSGTFTLTPNGLIDGRGGNGGSSMFSCGGGGGGAGGTLRVVSFGNAKFDGTIDLRGGRGGARGFLYGGGEVYSYYNANVERTSRYGGDGGAGRLLVVAPNYGNSDDIRVFGQVMTRLISTIPSPSVALTAPPNSVFTGSVLTTTYSFTVPTTEVYWNALNIASGAIVDLNFATATTGVTPVKIFVSTAATINGTLRINGDSTTMLASGSSAPSAAQSVQNFLGRPLYPGGLSYVSSGGPSFAANMLGMAGNMGGGDGGKGCTNGTYAVGREAANGAGPAPGVHNMNLNTGYYYSSWYQFVGDTGGSGAANATDGEDGWASFASYKTYNHLGSFLDTAATGLADQRGGGVSGQTAVTASPVRLGAQATDVTTIAVTNLASFVGSGGGGGNAGGDGSPTTNYTGITGSGGGGAGAIAIISPVSVTVGTTGQIQARGGDGQTPGMWYSANYYAHAGGGGGSGGTVYIVSDFVTIAPVTNAGGTDGATFDLRGGLGGGRRSQNQFAGVMAYPEYMSVGSFGGNGGYGRLVIDYKTSLNGNKPINNRWGMEQTAYDSTSNTMKALAGTARFFCPGMTPSGSGNPLTAIGRSKWYDLRSISPSLTSFTAGSTVNATLTLRVEGAQSLPNALGSAAGTWGTSYAANTGDPDPANTSGLFLSSAGMSMTGWRFMRFDASFTRTTISTGAPVAIDNMTATYTSDL